MEKRILLGVDLEEFDIPEEYGQSIPLRDQMRISREGLEALEPILSRYSVAATFFTTAQWAINEKQKILGLAVNHEIASHTYFHNRFEPGDLERSKAVLGNLSGQNIVGLRMPKLQYVHPTLISRAGYKYDSSLNPTWLPGRYNNLGKSTKIFFEGGIFEMPVSVSSKLRIPLFWLSLKNLPLSYYFYLCRKVLLENKILILYVHPWEFVNLDRFDLPWYVKKHSGAAMIDRLDRLLSFLEPLGTFSTHSQLICTLANPNI